jgi:hypothetical protein
LSGDYLCVSVFKTCCYLRARQFQHRDAEYAETQRLPPEKLKKRLLQKSNYAAAWPSVVRNGSAFPLKACATTLGYALRPVYFSTLYLLMTRLKRAQPRTQRPLKRKGRAIPHNRWPSRSVVEFCKRLFSLSRDSSQITRMVSKRTNSLTYSV